jgi:hypothetical protein
MPWNAKDKRVGSSWHPGDAVYKTPGTGPKAPTGYAAPGTAPAVAPITGGPEDTRTIAAQAAARAAVESRFQQQNQGNSAALDRANAAYRNQLPAGPNQKFDNISGMRKELEGRNAVQVYKNALPSYASALKSPDTPAGDQDMIYAFAKIMDPNSVVREGEANSVAALGTMGQQIAGSLRKQLDGNGKFTPELRTQLRNTLAGRIAEYDRAYNSERKFFRETAQRNSLNPDDILGPHLGDSYAAIENQYFRKDPNKSAAAARAEAAAGATGGQHFDPNNPYGPAQQQGPDMALATGKTREVPDPQANAVLDSLLRSGANDAQINAAMKAINHQPVDPQQTSAARAYMAKHPDYQGGFGGATKTEGQTLFNRVAASPVGVGIGAAADAGALGLSDEASGMVDWAKGKGSLSDLIAMANAKKQGAFAADPRASFIGNMVGSGGALLTGGGIASAARVPGLARMFGGRSLQRALPMIGDAAYGAAYGAGENNDNRLLGATVGGLAGAAGNVIGKKVTNVASNAVTGVKNEAVRYLDNAGVRMTGGQMMGGATKSIEDKLTSIPFVGDLIKNRRAEGFRDFNAAAFKQGGEPIGASVTDVGDAGLRQLQAAKTNAYGSALDPASIDMHDPNVVSDLTGVSAQARTIPNVNGAQDAALTALDHRIVGGTNAGGLMPGRNFQEAYRGLSRTARERASGDYGYEVGQSMEAGKDALATALEGQNPGAFQGFINANQSNRNLNILASALDAAKNQVGEDGRAIFSPAQLNTATSGNTRMFGGKVASATNSKPFADLVKYGQQVLPSKIPDSGTAGRAALGILAATAGGGATGAGGGYTVGEAGAGSTLGATLGLFAGALNTRAGQKALTGLLLRRPEVAGLVGNWMDQQAPLVGHGFSTAGSTYAAPAVTARLVKLLGSPF